MNGKCFLDSNLMVYAHTDLDLRKQQIAQHIIATEDSTISTQVLQETANILFKKFQLSWPDIQTVLNESASNNSLQSTRFLLSPTLAASPNVTNSLSTIALLSLLRLKAAAVACFRKIYRTGKSLTMS